MNDTTWAEMPRAAARGAHGLGARVVRIVIPFLIAGLLFLLGLTVAAALVVVAAGVLLVLTVLAPRAARAVEHIFERVGHWVGHALAVVLLGIVDLLVFTPIAFVMWVFRYDPLAPGVPRDAASFWHAHTGRSLPGKPFADERSLFVPAGAVGYRRSRPVSRVATVIGVVALLLLADLGAGWVYDEVASSTRGTAAVADDSFDAATQPAFRDAPWARDLLQEQTEIPAVRDPYLGYRVTDMTGRFTNFVNGARVSYEQATSGKKLVVWFFGASALFGAGQRDGYTIASQFARIAEEAGVPVQVRNFGRPATSSWQELQLLEQLVGHGEKPDFVVFYDGFNDLNTQINVMLSTVPVDIFDPSVAGVSEAAAKEQIAADTSSKQSRAAQQAASAPTETAPTGLDAVVDAYWDQAASHRVYDAIDELLNGSSAPKTQFVKGIDQQPTSDSPTSDQIAEAARNAVGLQARAAELATSIASGQGAEAAFYWQPFVYTKKLLPEEQPYTQFDGYDAARWIPAMAEVRKLLKKTPYTDLGNALDSATEPVLWDFVHTNEAGARLSAQAIFDNLRPRLEQRLAKSSSMNILGISAFYHDSAAALVQDGALVAAAQEERFTRKKHDPAFPANAIAYCLQRGEVDANDIDAVVYYDKPITTFVRLLKTYLRVGPKGARSFVRAMPLWTREKLWIPYEIDRGLDRIGYRMPKKLWFTEHHESHAASAFFPSPFESAAILTFDGVGEWATSSIGVGRGNHIAIERQLTFPNSLGLLYSAFTYFCGFRVNSGEYKLMGLAPYGEPVYVKRIVQHLLDLREDGSFRMDMRYFDYLSGLTMTNRRFADLFDGPPRAPESEITQRELDLAASIQAVTEEIVMRMARHAARTTGERNAVLAGGVALNCVANGTLLRDGPFDNIWIQPAAGDAGGAVGAALYGWHMVLDEPRHADGVHDAMQGAYLGPQFPTDEIAAWLDANDYPYERLTGEARDRAVAERIARGDVVGMLQGRMEFGPRALGHRSILGDPRSSSMQSTMNLKIKYRESFRPFAPAVLDDRACKVFEIEPGVESPYMLLVAGVRPELRVTPDDDRERSTDLREWVNEVRSQLPAITHVDYSARLQTVAPDTSPKFHGVIAAFEELTGCPVVINTSFNVRGEPIVCTPDDAYRCFMRTEMDTLVLEDCILSKADQPPFADEGSWQTDFILD